VSEKIIIGIDPGVNTGVALIVNGQIKALRTILPWGIEHELTTTRPARVVFEDSRLQSHTWSNAPTKAAAAKIARNVGEIDAWCKLIVGICDRLNIPAHGISPKKKGAKTKPDEFKTITGWTGPSNEHTRDAAMVAWPYRRGT